MTGTRCFREAAVFRTAHYLVLAAALVFAAIGARAAAPAAKEIVREKTVYVPYEKLKELYEKEGRGIFLPYEEFLKLWHAAQPKPPEPPPDKAPAPAVIRGGTYTGEVAGKVVRFSVTFDIEALKKGWSTLKLPLKGVALESAKLSDPKALFSATGNAYSIFLPAPGTYQATLKFSVRVQQEPGKKTITFGVPPVAVSRLELTIPEENVRVDVTPTLAVTQTTAADKATKVLAFLGNAADLSVSWMPPAGKLADGGAVTLASQSIRTYLGERILRISTEINYQVVRGQVDTLRIRVPENTRLLAVKGDNIREWAQEGEVLVVTLHSALKDKTNSYNLSLSFERILKETPSVLTVPFPQVEGVIRESGWIVFGHDSGLNVRVQTTTGLSQLDRDEVPEALRGGLGIGFRYLAHPLVLGLTVEKITPVIRSFATSVVSLGIEEDIWVGWIDYDITKAGVFRLVLTIPNRWNVATVGDGKTVEDYQIDDAEGGTKTLTVSLKSKALGSFRLPFKLTAQGSAAAAEMTLVAPVVVASQQDRGLFGVSAPKAFRVNDVELTKVTSADVDALFRSGIMNQVGAETGMPHTYGYRETGAAVKVRLEARKTEIKVLAQHLVEISDGAITMTHILDFEILYAAVDRLTFTAPSSLDDVIKEGVEAKEKKEVTKVSTNQGVTTWELTLQAPALGAVSVTVNHVKELKALEAGQPFPYTVPLVRPSAVREENGFVAIRKEGTLEIVPQPSGMEALDAGDLPDKLRRGQIYSAFRYFTAEPALNLQLTRYEYQALATTVVNLLRMKSVLSEERRLKTEAVLMVQNTDRQYLEINFSPEVNIFSISVNGKPQKPRRRKDESGARLIQIPASAGPGGNFPVIIVYDEPLAKSAMGTMGSVSLKTPEIGAGVPVAKVELELYLPPEYAYLSWAGTLNPKFMGVQGLWSRFKGYVNKTVKAHNRATPVSRAAARQQRKRPTATGAVDVEIPTQGYVPHHFESLAPVGTLSFTYVGRGIYSFVDFLAFALALVGGFILMTKLKWSKASTALCVVFLPLVLVWFFQGAVVEIFTSLFAGGLLLFAITIGAACYKRYQAHREARLALAPDPYLEDAAKPARRGKKSRKKKPEAEKPEAEKPATEEPAADADKPTEEKPADEKPSGDDSPPTDNGERS